MSQYIVKTNWKQSLKSLFVIGVGKSLFIWFLAISFIPLASISTINYFNSNLGLNKIVKNLLVTTSQLRIEHINNFFEQKVNFLEFESKQANSKNFFLTLSKEYKRSGKTYKNPYNVSIKYSTLIDNYKLYFQKGNFKNIYFLNEDGVLLFSLIDEFKLGTDFSRDLSTNELLSTGFNKAIFKKTICFSDIAYNRSDSSLLESFLTIPVYSNNSDIIGVVALKIDISVLNSILMNKTNLGETGGYMIGSDLLYRSLSRYESENVVLKKKSENENSLSWLDYITHQHDKHYLSINKLDEKEIFSYKTASGKDVKGIYRNLYYIQELGVNWAHIEEIEHDEIYAHAEQMSDIVKIAFVVTIIIVFFISIFVTRRFVRPIKKLSAWAKQVAMGELVSQNIKAPKNEVGEMVTTFNTLVKSLLSYAETSQSASYGDYSKSVEIRSGKDVLGKSMNRMVESFKTVVQQANKIANGDYSTNIKARSNKDTLGIALSDMTKKLRNASKEINEQDWLKGGINQMGTTLSGQTDINQLSSEVISFLCGYLNAQVGLFYTMGENNSLELASTYAFTDKNKVFKKFKFGEGIIGQVAKDGKLITVEGEFNNLPEINLGFDSKMPKSFTVAPFIYEGNLLGVILLGTATKFPTLYKQFFQTCLDSIAIAVNTVQASERVELLLKQTQEQASELTVQQEELRQANEELEEQTKALTVSEESLKNQQEELKVINEELEERTNDLEIQRDSIRNTNEDLKKAQAEIEQKAIDLQKTSQYKSEFLANMSHELRTPLNSILVLSQLLGDNKKQNLTDKEIQFAKTINSSGSDLLELINEILDLSKVEAGKIDLYIEDLHFDDLNQFIQRTFSPLTDEKKLKLNFNIQDTAPESIKTDVQRAYQIIKNLISNAIKFTNEGEIKISISRPNSKIDLSAINLNSENAIAIAVKDTGVGIPKDKIDLIFEAFKQVDGTTSRKFGGTGLGLTISRSFAELLGGEIHLESIENKGTTFTLYLPLAIEDKTQKSIEEVQSKMITSSQKRTTKKETKAKKLLEYTEIKDDKENIEDGDKLLLVIEDDENFSKILYDLAHEKGFKCIIALDGESGLHYADFYQPHAIILDIGLPGIDGYEVMERLKNNSKTRHIPVHFISAADKSLEAMKMGAIGYLTKPVSPAKLDDAFKKIENIISKPIKKILVVEDDEIMRKSIVNLLDDDSIKITAIESGEEAYSLLLKEKFDCQILDLGLKDMTGFDLLEKIRKNKKIIDLPIIIYTGKDLSKDEEAKLTKYADSIILKGARSFERLLSESTLFLHQLEADMPDKKRKLLKKMHDKEAILENKKILIVDDDMRNVFALSSLLEDKGMKTIVAKNGKEGLKKLEENKDVDLVLMDIMMPEMDGYEATYEIRKQKKYKDLPVIALTAKAMKEDREKCIAAGANDYLAKPVDTEKLLSLLRVWLYTK